MDLMTQSGIVSIQRGKSPNLAVSAAATGSFALSSTPEGFNTLVLHTDTHTPLATYALTYPGSDMIFYVHSSVSASASISDIRAFSQRLVLSDPFAGIPRLLRAQTFQDQVFIAFSGFALRAH